MAIKIVTRTSPERPTGVAQYWDRIVKACAARGVGVEWVMLPAWQRGQSGGDPARDIIIVDNHDALCIPENYAVIAVQHGCAMEHGLRCRSEHVAMGRDQWKAAQRKRTFWVGCSDWAAYHCRRHMGVQADRIIYGCVDTNLFFPSERQRKRDAHVPVVLHHCKDPNKGAGAVEKIAAELGNAFEVKLLNVPSDGVPDAMREADMWLCLSKSEGLPTVAQEAIATDLIVVGTDVGIFWPFASGTPLHGKDTGATAWLNAEIGAVVFDYHWRDYPEHVAAWVRQAWAQRGGLRGREFARRWWNAELFGQKWLETIWAAAKQLGVADVAVGEVSRHATAPAPRGGNKPAGIPPRPYPQPQPSPYQPNQMPGASPGQPRSGRGLDAPPRMVVRP